MQALQDFQQKSDTISSFFAFILEYRAYYMFVHTKFSSQRSRTEQKVPDKTSVIVSFCSHTPYPFHVLIQVLHKHVPLLSLSPLSSSPSLNLWFSVVVPTLNRGGCCCVVYLRCSRIPSSSLRLSAVQISLLIKLSIVLICWARGIC